MPKASIVLALVAALCARAHAAAPSERDFLDRIRAHARLGESEKLRSLAAEFYRAYPKSDSVAEVRLYAADAEEAPEEAIRQYRILLEKYRYFKDRDRAALGICRTLYLLARWGELEAESARVLGLFPKSEHTAGFLLYRAKALIHLERFEEALEGLRRVSELNREYDELAATLLVMAYVERKTTGYSRAYLVSLRELVTGFPEAPSAPGALYLLGRFHENRGDYGRAYSAYADLMKRYPRAVESGFAAGRMEELKAHKPTPAPYLPEEAAIRQLDSIDLRHDSEPGGADEEAEVAYAVALGPFFSKAEAERVRRIISGEFSPIQSVAVAGRHLIYVGRARDTDSAVSLKIRLAEEFAINGNIVRIRRDENRRYIYGD